MPPKRPAGNKRLKNALAKTLIVIALMNLNGLAYMMFGVTQVFSLALLICSVALFALYKRLILNRELSLFLLLTLGYVFFGILYIPVFNDSQATLGELPTLAGTILLTLSIVLHIQHFENLEEQKAFFHFARNVSIISATAVLFSPLLYEIYTNPPPSADYRNAGVFANPNEAGLISALAVSLILLFPFRNFIAQYSAIGLTSLATITTFSRAAIAVLVIILFLSAWKTRIWLRVFLAPTALILLIFMFSNVTLVVDWLSTQTLIDLDPQQRTRLVSILRVLDGQIDTETSGGRSELFAFAVEKAMSVFPFGTGLNTFQAMEGGLRSSAGGWLGAHNSFLMVWGEAGFFMLLVLVALFATVLINVARRGLGVEGLFFPLIFLGAAMFSHEIFSLRFINVVMVFMLVQSKISFGQRSRCSVPASGGSDLG